MTRLLRQVSVFRRAPRFTQIWALPVWLILGIARLIVKTVPFRRVAPHLGHAHGTSSWTPLINAEQERRARLIGRTVQAAARRTPWVSNCFPQAMAAHVLLSVYRVPHTVYFGLKRGDAVSGLEAHAWVASGRVYVTGGRGFDAFTVVGVFASVSVRSLSATAP